MRRSPLGRRTVSTTILVLACCISWESARAEEDLFGLPEGAAPEELYWEILRLQAAGLLSDQSFAQVQRELDIVTAHYAADRDSDDLVRRVLIAALRRTYRKDPGEENAPLHAAQEGRAYARRLHSAGVREAETYAQRTVFIAGMLGVPTSEGELALIVALPAGGYLVGKVAQFAFKKAALLLRGLRTPEEVLSRAGALGTHVERIESKAGLEGVIGKDAVASVELAPRAPEGLTIAARGAGREATGFLGSKRAPLANAPYQQIQNADAVIGGRTFSGHALDQMRNRGLTPSRVENTIQTGVRSADPIVGRLRYFDPVNNVTVITEGERIVTVIPGKVGP